MSADTPTPQADGPHLDELATSAALDGEATTEELAHLDTCAACRAEVARLRAVQARLAASPTEVPDPVRRERSIAAALAAFEPHGRVTPLTSAPPLTQAPGSPAPGGPVPGGQVPDTPAPDTPAPETPPAAGPVPGTPAAGTRPPGGPVPATRAPATRARVTPSPLAPASTTGGRRRRRTTDLAPWLGIAAVVLLVALAVPLLSRLGGDSTDETAASGVAESEESAADETATAAPAPAVDVGDLGPLVAGSDLRPVVDDALGDVGSGAADGGGSEDAGGGEAGGEAFGGDAVGDQAPGDGAQVAPDTGEEDMTEAAGGATQTESELESGADGGAERPDATVTTPSTTAAGGDAPQLADGTDRLRASRLTACEPSVRTSLPDAGALLLTGTATVDGAPALVYGFAAPSARPTVLVALVAVDGCRTITMQTYARD